MKIAALFPGQGSHGIGMSADLTTEFDSARQVFDTAESTLPGLRALIETGPLDALTLTANQQPALVTASLAAYRAWQAHTGLMPFAAAGHSLGEYSAHVAAGTLTLADALTLTRRRGELMQAAVPVGVGAMAAIMGDPGVVEEVCAGMEGVQPANYNAPTQTVISGEKAAVEAACAQLKARGLKAIPLKVSAPFHCALMQPAAEALAPDLRAAPLGQLAFPVIANVNAQPIGHPSQVPELLIEQITGSVRWVQSIRQLAEMGADVFVEFGPGTVLTGLVKRILPDARVMNVGNLAQVKEFEL
ncbi:[acyl-carrier-protein] S-malonyltransferase [Deinococcus psychrotolerans]|uniref:Malonyl CoA-acyl carrier protein transacylase n=1 Tax=Deinococcus psychrotolerans TaxID=2489213 RepID=A0A3G8YEQ0_9DEIO|nr:ACP S-malonyltransferase [Deinococcus psychrotolerans]AZI43859.1 [acyl-carrier-protein] S-malonyltransferase [Deinococcus psychrotolerans]